jgi:crotonobetainyl-CoA:carnitine CoA-transferase CaiB-like acyl-CoA transferase
MADKPQHLLDGYKVLDFTHFVAGPTTTRLMAGMGAEIIKVELAPHGDRSREFDYVATNGAPFSSSKTGARKAFVSICAGGKASI